MSRILRAPGTPGEEALGERTVAGAERGVHDEELRKTPWHRHGQSETQEPAPVLAHQCDVGEIEPLDQRQERVTMEVEGIDRVIDGFVRPAEAEIVGRHDAITGAGHQGDKLAIEIAPGGLTVETEEHFFDVARPFVEIVEAQALVSRQVLEIMRGKAIARKIGESVVGRAECLDHRLCPPDVAPS